MDNTPLHPAITTLAPDPSGTRHGAFLAAIPHNRSMYRTTLCLRLASLLLALVILGGVLGSMHETDDMYVSNWAMGSPTAALAMLWSSADLVALIVRDRGVRWTKSKERPRSTRFSWGSPGGHVAAHLLIWAPTAATMGVVISGWLSYMDLDPTYWQVDERQTHTMTALIFFMFWLMVVHFALFVFACVEVDNIRRQYSDVVFVPRGELCEMVPVPPTSAWEIFVPRRMMLSYFANHYPESITVEISRGGNDVRPDVREGTDARGLAMPPAYDMFAAERKQRRPTGLYRNNGTLAEAFKLSDGDRVRRKFAGRQIVKNKLRVFEASPESHEGQGESRQAIGSFAGMGRAEMTRSTLIEDKLNRPGPECC
ncbi:hypothetical protein K4K57_003505 [Colletotrichum sp. SAR 10_99]|nr:hypothetical protein K4K57_003505 [Colletotrichum sp. SAR 10_99]